ncbi:MAG: metallophosphoesterase family protein [Anaerovoracaceae bacterium]
MNIFVVSDTHGRLDKAIEMYKRFEGELAGSGSGTGKIDMIIHCGDHEEDGIELSERLRVPVTAVPGNCDGSFKRKVKTVDTPYGQILVTHGHTEYVDRDMSNLVYLAEDMGCAAVCFGHTHVPVDTEYDGIHLVNPGSLTYPRDGSSGSAALITADEKHFTVKIEYYDGGRKKKKARGGFLRSIMNYSDGQ